LKHAFAVAFFIEVLDSGQEQILQGNHADELTAFALNYWEAREARFGHAGNDGSQRLIGIGDDRLAQHIGQRRIRRRG
jgi:hypothetical protein